MSMHRSPGILKVLQEVRGIEKPKILDLGATNTSLLSYFSQQKCRIYFEDLPDFLFGQTEHRSPEDIDEQLQNYLLDYGDTKFDIVLSWDIVNYLELHTVTSLMEKINRHCRKDTLFHMIRRTNSKIPPKPCLFQIDSSGNLLFDSDNEVKRPVPSHSTVRLLQHMTNQYIESNLMNHQGMHEGFVEHILRYKPPVIGAMTNAEPDTNKTPLEEFQSLALDKIYSRLKTINKPKILVISSQTNKQYSYLSEFGGELTVENIYPAIEKFNSGEMSVANFTNHVFKYPSALRFDAIFLWDIFNFCNNILLQLLCEKLSGLSHAKTILHWLSYTDRHVQTLPSSFAITFAGNLRTARNGKPVARQHYLTAAGIMNLMPNYYVSGTYTKRQGMMPGVCEYLFEYSDKIRRHEKNRELDFLNV